MGKEWESDASDPHIAAFVEVTTFFQGHESSDHHRKANFYATPNGVDASCAENRLM
jgi:hypothetical protein